MTTVTVQGAASGKDVAAIDAIWSEYIASLEAGDVERWAVLRRRSTASF